MDNRADRVRPFLRQRKYVESAVSDGGVCGLFIQFIRRRRVVLAVSEIRRTFDIFSLSLCFFFLTDNFNQHNAVVPLLDLFFFTGLSAA